jgi:26S proteasome regulatory subunit N3
LASYLRKLFDLYRSSSVSKRESCQATLLNLILRCFIVSGDFVGASEFMGNTLFPEHKMNNEFIKYLYYTSLIKAVELDYQESYSRVGQAIRKSPEKSARGFKLHAQKLAIVVEMLLGEVPVRSMFTEGELFNYLYPYYELTRSLVKGDVKNFGKVVERYRQVYQTDGLLILINRLTLNVIRAGLKKINLSYSRIGFADIAQKLSLPQNSDVESLISKAIRDGVVTGQIDISTQSLIIKENKDTYGTNVPQLNFQKRIDYCTAIINNCNKSILYRENDNKDKKEKKTDDDDMEKIFADFEDEFF